MGARQRLHGAQPAHARALLLGGFESFDCGHDGGTRRDAVDTGDVRPPCFEAPQSLYDNRVFPSIEKGEAPNVPAPGTADGTRSRRTPPRTPDTRASPT